MTFLKKRILPLGILLCMLFTLLPAEAFAATNYWEADYTAEPDSGSGTTSDPYIVTSPEELYYVLKNSRHAALGEDINLRGKTWRGTQVSSFKASLKGRGHTIWGLDSDCGTLIYNMTGGSIENLNIEATSATLGAGTLARNCNGAISDCTVFGTVRAGLGSISSNSGSQFIGGLVGTCYNGSIKNCQSFVNYYLTATGAADAFLTIAGIAAYAGSTVENCVNYGSLSCTVLPDENAAEELKVVMAGIVGWTYGGETAISYCTNNGQIYTNAPASATSYRYAVGGIVGNASEGGTIQYCQNSAMLDAGGAAAGGIVGTTQQSSKFYPLTVSDCKNSAVLSSTGLAGGIVGDLRGKASVGMNLVTLCTNEGPVTGGTYVGGIAGHSDSRIVECTNNRAVNGSIDAAVCGGIVGHNETTLSGSDYNATEEPSGVVLQCSNTSGVLNGGICGGIAGINDGYLYQSENTGPVSGVIVGGIAGQNRPTAAYYATAMGVISSCAARCDLTAQGGIASGIAANGYCRNGDGQVTIQDSYFRGNIGGSGTTAYGIASQGAGSTVNGSYAVFSASGFSNVYALYAAEETGGTYSAPYCAGSYANTGGADDFAVIRSTGELQSGSTVTDLDTLGGTVAARGAWRAGSPYPEPTRLSPNVVVPIWGRPGEAGYPVYYATDGARIVRVFAEGWAMANGPFSPTATVTHEDGTTDTFTSTWRAACAEYRMAIDDTDTVRFSLEGYQDQNIPAALLGSLTEIKLLKDRSDENPTLLGLYLDCSSGGYRKTYNLLTESANVFVGSLTAYSLYVDVDWHGNNPGTVSLMQGSYQRKVLQEGWNRDLSLGQILKLQEGSISIRMDNTVQSSQTKVKIKVYEATPENIPVDTGDSVASGAAPEGTDGIADQSFAINFGPLSSLGLPMSLELQSDGTIVGTLGVTWASMSESGALDGSGTKTASAKSCYTIIKDQLTKWARRGSTISDKEYKALADSINRTSKNAPYNSKANYGISVGLDMLGYVEGKYLGNGIFHITECGAVIKLKGSVTYTQPVYIVLPFYVETGLSATLSVTSALERDENTGKLVPKGSLDEEPNQYGTSLGGSLTFFGGPGIGDPKIVSGSLRATGTISVSMAIPLNADTLKLTSQVKGSFVGSIAGFSNEWTTWKGDPFTIYENGEWFPDYDLFSLQSSSEAVLSEPSREYLNWGSEFLGDGDLVLQSAGTASSALLSNIYTYADVQLASFSDGGQLLVWSGDLASRDDADRTALFYSYYDPDDGTWSEPALVETDDGTADFYPILRCIDDAAYLVWNDADTILSGTAGEETTEEALTQRLNTLGVSYASFDQSSASFTDTSSITGSNSTADLLPDVTTVGGVPTVVWASSSKGLALENAVLYSASLTDGVWTVTELAAASGVDALAAAEENDALAVYYSLAETDTSSLRDLYRFADGTGEVWSGTEDTTESKPTVSNGHLAWYEAGAVRTDSGLTAPISGGGDRFQYIHNGSGSEAILYATATETGSSLNVIFNTGNGWGEPVLVAETDSGLFYSYSGTFLSDGTLSVAANLWDESGDRIADLMTYQVSPYPALSISSLDYDHLTMVTGADLAVSLEVENPGAIAAEAIRVDFYDGDTLLGTDFIAQPVPSGASASLTAYCPLPEESLPDTITVKACAIGTACTEAGTAEITLTATDLSLEEMRAMQLEDQTLVSVLAVNRSQETLEDMTLTLRQDSADGPELATLQTGTISSGTSETMLFILETPLEEGTVLYVTAEEHANGENLISNNSILGAVVAADAVGFSFTASASSSTVELMAENTGSDSITVQFIAASYQDGRLIDSTLYQTTLEAGAEFWTHSISLTSGDTVKVFALDESHNPLAPCQTIEIS